MAELDLRALSAPIEAMREKVQSAYSLLDAQWKAIIEQLSELPIPCSVSYTYACSDFAPTDFESLDWRKIKGGRRLCHVAHSLQYDQFSDGQVEHEEVVPFEEWGAEFKLAMLSHVPGLFDAALKQTKQFVNKVQASGGKS